MGTPARRAVGSEDGRASVPILQGRHFCLLFGFGCPPFVARVFKTEFFRIFFCKCGNFEAGRRAPPVFERLMVRCPSATGNQFTVITQFGSAFCSR